MNFQIIALNQNNSIPYDMSENIETSVVNGEHKNWWQNFFDKKNVLDDVSTQEIVFRSLGAFLSILIILLTIVGNILVIVVVTRFHRMRTVTNILLAR